MAFCRLGESQMNAPMFSDDRRQSMLLGTSSKWAANLTEEDLQAVLWMVGEFGRRATNILTDLDKYWAECPPQDQVASARAKLALEGLFRVVCGDRPSVEEYISRWHTISERVWATAQSREPALAPEEMGDRWPVIWKENLVGWIKDPTHQWLGCTGLWVPNESSAGAEFLAALNGPPSNGQAASVGGVPSIVKPVPPEMGQLSVFWCGPSS